MNINKKGITSLEIIAVIAIIGVLSVIIVAPFSSFRSSKTLDTGVEEIVSLLNDARLSTLSSKGGFQYGVHFETSRIVLFKGTVFNDTDPNNKEILLNNTLEISNIALTGAGSDVVFERLTGKTSQDGTITLRIKNDPSKSVLITIQPTGVVGF